MSFNIAIDGPAGAGKSTIAKTVAKELGFIYVDTGAMYRAIALFLIRNDIDASEIDRIEEVLDEINITIEYENNAQLVMLNGENVNSYIRTEKVGIMTSAVSTHACVRNKLLQLQRQLAETSDVLMDGRDIGTCVLPNADLKIYLTASSRTRAERRWKELTERGVECDINQIEKDIIDRDNQDMNREIAPLKQADDAVLVDTSNMNIEEVVAHLIALVNEKKA
ncbi:MAG: (d)CMP kinase [Lachnospiraceae bacterium]|nr:(d)CMP kinase [Lachnospiraceae bacterium]